MSSPAPHWGRLIALQPDDEHPPFIYLHDREVAFGNARLLHDKGRARVEAAPGSPRVMLNGRAVTESPLGTGDDLVINGLQYIFQSNLARAVPQMQICVPLPSPQRSDEICGYRLLGDLGTGATAVVKKAQHIASGKHFAIKMMEKRRMLRRPNGKREVELMRNIRHPNIVALHEVRRPRLWAGPSP